jgi:hypothetical protein
MKIRLPTFKTCRRNRSDRFSAALVVADVSIRLRQCATAAQQPDDEQHDGDDQEHMDERADVYVPTTPSSQAISRMTAMVNSIVISLFRVRAQLRTAG